MKIGMLSFLAVGVFMVAAGGASAVGGIARAIEQSGFAEIRNTRLLKHDFDGLYQNFDVFISLMDDDQQLAESIYASEKEFLERQENKARYCAAPPSFRNPAIHRQKRFNKIYYQFIKEHYDLCRKRYSEVLVDNFDALAFLHGMEKIDKIAKEFFAVILDEPEPSFPGITKLMYGEHGELTIITKVVRYEQTDGEKWGTTAHVDKSALSLIWDSNDADDESLVICPNREAPSLELLQKPERAYAHRSDCSSTILIPGAALAMRGINWKPTVHGVLPLCKKFRTAVISFLLIPETDMSSIVCDFRS